MSKKIIMENIPNYEKVRKQHTNKNLENVWKAVYDPSKVKIDIKLSPFCDGRAYESGVKAPKPKPFLTKATKKFLDKN